VTWARSVEGYTYPEGLWYHPQEHLWLSPGPADAEGRREVLVGLDVVGAEALGDVVYVQLSEPGQAVAAGEPLGSLEAEKMVRPLLAPVSGTVLEVNAALGASPRLLNTDPYGQGWILRVLAGHWDRECRALLHEAGEVEAWVRREVQALRERA
jgi:glycine cleavage system H protein